MDDATEVTSSALLKLEMKVQSIAHGWISATITADGAKTELLLDDITDPVFELADWTEVIQSGETAMLQLRGGSWTRLVAELTSAEHRRLRVWDNNDAGHPDLDVCVPMPVLVDAVRGFLDDIEQHPCLASNWICFMDLLDEQYDHLGDEADKLWDQGVHEGQWPDDWDQQKEFDARYVADRIELTAEQANAVERYRNQLRAAIKRLQSNGS